jgi:hypothetical protein
VVGKFSQRAELRGLTGSGSGGQILNKTQLHAPGHTSSCCCIGSLALQFKLRGGGGAARSSGHYVLMQEHAWYASRMVHERSGSCMVYAKG